MDYLEAFKVPRTVNVHQSSRNLVKIHVCLFKPGVLYHGARLFRKMINRRVMLSEQFSLWVSKVTKYFAVVWFCIPTLMGSWRFKNWFKNSAPLPQPIRSKNKTNPRYEKKKKKKDARRCILGRSTCRPQIYCVCIGLSWQIIFSKSKFRTIYG